MTSSSSKISTAVILAAGMGIRLRNVTGLLPKGLLEIGGQPLIYRSLESLKNEGIDRTIIVTGFQESLYYERLKPKREIPVLEFVHSRLRSLMNSATKLDADTMALNYRKWQSLIDLQSRIAEYIRSIGEPEE